MGRHSLIRDLIRERQADLTAAERQVTSVLLDDSLINGLQSITRLAEDAGVSTPTVIRLARKLGFDGFPDLQNAIRDEVAARFREPLAKLDAWRGGLRHHIVSRFADAMAQNINRTLDRLDLAAFDQAAALLSDSGRRLFLLGGRITRSNAHYFYNHLQIIRPNVFLLDNSPSVWPQALLDMDDRSVLVVFDIRRYEADLARLAGIARGRGAETILFTDQWGSPIEKHAQICFRTMVEAPSSWDSTLAISFLTEALIAEVQSRAPQSSTERIGALERMLGQTRVFRAGHD